MDVFARLSVVALILVATACSNTKTVTSVFPENDALDSSSCTGQAVSNRFIVQWEDGTFTAEESSDKATFVEEFVKPNLQNLKLVEHDRVIQAYQADQQAVVVTTNSSFDTWGQQMIQLQSVWNQSVYGNGITVGVVDSYVDVSHPQLSGQIKYNSAEIPNNGVDDDNNGVVDDYPGAVFVSGVTGGTPSSHGTHVSGIIAADANLGSVYGVAPRSKIVSGQFINNSGSGNLSDAILAMQYVASRGAKVINASWGGAPCTASVRDAFKSLEQQGVLVVVAAGNSGRDIDLYPEFPAAFGLSNQITIAASTSYDVMASWSNSGFGLVHLAAPGSAILSTLPNNQRGYMDGTSMAAPFVSGAAALIWSAHPNASVYQVRQALMESVDVTANKEFKVSTRGRLNVAKALQRLSQLAK